MDLDGICGTATRLHSLSHSALAML